MYSLSFSLSLSLFPFSIISRKYRQGTWRGTRVPSATTDQTHRLDRFFRNSRSVTMSKRRRRKRRRKNNREKREAIELRGAVNHPNKKDESPPRNCASREMTIELQSRLIVRHRFESSLWQGGYNNLCPLRNIFFFFFILFLPHRRHVHTVFQ